LLFLSGYFSLLPHQNPQLVCFYFKCDEIQGVYDYGKEVESETIKIYSPSVEGKWLVA